MAESDPVTVLRRWREDHLAVVRILPTEVSGALRDLCGEVVILREANRALKVRLKKAYVDRKRIHGRLMAVVRASRDGAKPRGDMGSES